MLLLDCSFLFSQNISQRKVFPQTIQEEEEVYFNLNSTVSAESGFGCHSQFSTKISEINSAVGRKVQQKTKMLPDMQTLKKQPNQIQGFLTILNFYPQKLFYNTL